MKPVKIFFFAVACIVLSASCSYGMSEIKIKLDLDNKDYVSGEKVRGVVDVMNSSPRKVSVGYANSKDKLILEVFRSSDKMQLEKYSDIR